MSNIIPIDQAAANLPVAMRQRVSQGLAANANFSEGVRDAFPLLSFKAKMFRARVSGQETALIDPSTRQPISYLDVIMVNASRTLAKTYYIKGYTEGDLNPPDCWSLDSIRPDPSVVNKVSPSCISCPMNAFGSKITPAGKAAKACQDARRVAVMLPHMLGQKDPLIMMLRVPQSSLKNLKAYAQMLERHGIDPVGVVTRISFDTSLEISFPKLVFNFVNVLDDQSYVTVLELAEGSFVTSMLQAPDFENAIATPQQQNPQTGPIMQPLAPQAGPVLEDPIVVAAAQQQAAPVQQRTGPVMQEPVAAAAAELIELPDGRYFNRATGQFVEKQPEVQVQLDPNVIALPGDQFFNIATKKYVTGPQLGAPEVAPTTTTTQATAAAPAQQTTRKRTPTTAAKKSEPPKKAPAPAKQPEQPTDQSAALAAAVNQAVAQQAVDNGGNQGQEAPVNGGDAPGQAAVMAAPQSMDELLAKIIPGKPQ